MADPSNVFAIDDAKFITGLNVDIVVANGRQLLEAVEKYYTIETAVLSSMPQETVARTIAIIILSGKTGSFYSFMAELERQVVTEVVRQTTVPSHKLAKFLGFSNGGAFRAYLCRKKIKISELRNP